MTGPHSDPQEIHNPRNDGQHLMTARILHLGLWILVDKIYYKAAWFNL